ncbi:MAG: hypothetical protein ACYSSO_08795 [Planctomycetota bacterium]
MDSKQRKFGNYRIPDSDCRTIARRSGIKIKLNAGRYATAFSLLEVIAALVILALVSSSVLVVINRCMASAAESALRMQAFEVARENMEELLSSDSASVIVEYGTSDKYPQIQWQTAVEAFYEAATERMWLQATCSAEYTDSAGEQQTVELTHWLTNLTKKQMLDIIQQQSKEKQLSAEQIIEDIEQAAEYAGVDVETIEQWIENGMPVTEDGYFIKEQLDLYKKSGGKPSAEDIKQLSRDDADSIKPAEQQDGQAESAQQDVPESKSRKEKEPETGLICGYTMDELMQLDFAQILEIISNCDKFQR